MKIIINFERELDRFPTQFRLRIWMRFTECSYEEFHDYLDKNSERLMKMRLSYDVGHFDKVIYFVGWHL